FPGQHGIRLTQHLTTLGMTDQYHAASSISQLTGCNLASQGTLHRFYCAVLRPDSNRLTFQAHDHLMEVKTRRHDRNLNTNRQRQLTKTFNQLRNAGAGTVHLPVTSYQWSTHAAPRRSKWAQILPNRLNTGKRIKYIDWLRLLDGLRASISHDFSQSLGMTTHLSLIVTFNHDAHQRFGSGLAQQHAPTPRHLSSNLITRLLH